MAMPLDLATKGRQGTVPCGGDGIDLTVTALLVMLYVVPTPFQIFSEKSTFRTVIPCISES